MAASIRTMAASGRWWALIRPRATRWSSASRVSRAVPASAGATGPAASDVMRARSSPASGSSGALGDGPPRADGDAGSACSSDGSAEPAGAERSSWCGAPAAMGGIEPGGQERQAGHAHGAGKERTATHRPDDCHGPGPLAKKATSPRDSPGRWGIALAHVFRAPGCARPRGSPRVRRRGRGAVRRARRDPRRRCPPAAASPRST